MIIGNAVSAIESGNIESTGEFKIRNSAKAFSILSSTIYSNKIRAIIRELSCNAIDSHKAANNLETPFEVHLPTRMEPHFHVKDFGTGLSHDEVLHIYTTYFESTKQNSNDFIGALGLGSKSPFSYTENFTVTAIKDGEKNIYTAFINEHGVPSIARLDSSTTEESNGVTVSFAVNAADTYKFNEEARFVYATFDQHPNVIGSQYTQYKPEVDTPIMDGVDLMRSSSFSSAYAVMGNVAYPINVPNAAEVLGKNHNILSNNIRIKFNIGELDVQASREGLSYIPSTIKAIKTKLEAIVEALNKSIVEIDNKYPNLWEKLINFDELRKTYFMRTIVDNYIASQNYPVHIARHNMYITKREHDIMEKYNVQVTRYYASNKTLKKVQHWYGDITLWINKDITFVKNDVKSAIEVRIRSILMNPDRNNQAQIYLISSIDKSKDMDFDGFLKEIHNPINVINASDIPYERVSRTKATTTGKNQIYKVTDIMTSVAVNPDEGVYYYAPLNRNDFEISGGLYAANQFVFSIMKSGIAELKDIPVYGVRKAAIKNIEGKKNWINLETYIKKIAKKYTNTTNPIAKSIISKKVNGGMLNTYNVQVSKKSPLYEVVSFHKEATYNTSQTQRYYDYFSQIMLRFAKYDVNAAIQPEIKRLNSIIDNNYPLLTSINISSYNAEHVAQYINLIDSVKGV